MCSKSYTTYIPVFSLFVSTVSLILVLLFRIGASVKMEHHFQAALDPRKQELLEARFIGARVSWLKTKKNHLTTAVVNINFKIGASVTRSGNRCLHCTTVRVQFLLEFIRWGYRRNLRTNLTVIREREKISIAAASFEIRRANRDRSRW